MACLEAPREAIHDQAFNVGKSGENYRIRDVAETVKDVVPGCDVVFAPGASPDTRNYRVDFTKIETKLPGFSSEWTLRRGIEELHEAFISAELSADDWTSSRYYRLGTVQSLRSRGVIDDELRRVIRTGDRGHGALGLSESFSDGVRPQVS